MALRVEGLTVSLVQTGAEIVSDVNFEIEPGEILGLVGESGSGKSTTGVALLGLARAGARITGGSVTIGDRDILALPPAEARRARGSLVAYVPQDPAAAMNPATRIGKQLREMIEVHPDRRESDSSIDERIAVALAEVKLPSDRAFLRRYPHELSGGQLQRVCIAMAFLLRPSVIVMDEPTTGLDVTTQAFVLDTVRRLCADYSVATLYISHDLSVVANLADRVMVMYMGEIVETAPTEEIFGAARHPYTRQLISAIPATGPRAGAEVAPAPPEDDVLAVRSLNAWYGSKQVVFDVNLDLAPQECVAIVGESGSGKTTLARSLIGLHPKWDGELLVNGSSVAQSARRRTSAARQAMQYIFQSPYSALNPRRTVASSVAVPLRCFFDVSRKERAQRVTAALEAVGLTAADGRKMPRELSGGERQRVAIARALVCEPDVLICDEITSALDVSVQASVVELLGTLQREQGLSMLFITHDLALARSIASRVIVMNRGEIVEQGPTEQIYANPQDPYVKRLIGDSPTVPEHLVEMHARTMALQGQAS